MKHFQCLLILASCVLLVSCNAGSTNQTDFINKEYLQEQIEIQNLVREIFDAAQKKELDKLDAIHLYGPKFTKFDDWEPLDRQDATTAKISERDTFEALDKFTYELDGLKVDVFENVAIATFVINYDIQMGQDEASAKARSTLVFVKDGNNWKITHEHFSPFKANP